MTVAEFLRTYSARGPQLMWFLGAGCSVAAGVPSAGDMIWEFKRILFCTEQRVPVTKFPDLGDGRTRSLLQSFFDGRGGYPPAGAAEEYAFYFEAVRRTEADRRRYIQDAVANVRPSFGHVVLAGLMAVRHSPIVWTTNFDRVVEDAAYAQAGTSTELGVATIDTPHIATTAFGEDRFPLLVKLHGDFQSTRLRNTREELRRQDEQLRELLVAACCRFGLCVVGYSGRDSSVMDALTAAVETGQSLGTGLFWFHRPDCSPTDRVTRLIEVARAKGVDAHLIDVETFDELMGDVVSVLGDLPEAVRQRVQEHAPRVGNAPLPERGGAWPVVRLNALPVIEAPTVCRLIDCKVGGTGEVRDAVDAAGVDLIVGRRQSGVIAFGRNCDALKVFEPLGIKTFDLHPIETRRLRYESAELGLLYEALAKALCRQRPLIAHRVRNRWVVGVDTARATDPIFEPLRRATQAICGKLADGTTWAEAVWLALDYRMDRLWIVLEPTVWIERADRDGAAAGDEFRRKRLTGRYNVAWNAIVDAWASVVVDGERCATLAAYGIDDGIDARFTISRVTAYSRRIR